MNLQTIFNTFTDHTMASEGGSHVVLGKLSFEELKKIEGALFNMREAALSGLRTAGDLISAYEEARGGFDNNAAGWLVMHLTENLEGMLDLQYQVREEFVRRGFGLRGEKIKGVRRG